MKKLIIAILIVFAGCTDADRTVEILRDQGYTDIIIHGHSWLGCSNDDMSCTEFVAISPAGRRVIGAVGCGAGCGKGCTIRFR